MKFTVLSQFFPPETFAGANRAEALAVALADEGEVTVTAPHPSYPHPSLYDGATVPPAVPQLRLCRTGTFVPHGRSIAGRAIAELGMAIRLALAAARISTDVVVASSPGMFLGPAGLALARLRGVPFVWDIRDLTWEYVREVATRRRVMALGSRMLSRLMWMVAARADLLVAATPGIAAELRRRHLRAVVVPNSVDSALLDLFTNAPPRPVSTPNVTYAGLIGLPQALGVLCDVAERLPDVTFNLVGDGPELASLIRRATVSGLLNLRFHGYLPRDRLAEVYAASDILFAQLHASGLHTATALPSKLFEYMAAGRPIVYAGEGLAVEELQQIGCAFAVDPGDADAIAAAIQILVDDASRRLKMGLAGRAFVEGHLSRQEEMSALVPEILRLLGSRARRRTVVAA
jgi:glycosyltransferase involved in cell wall biosynthesis